MKKMMIENILGKRESQKNKNKRKDGVFLILFYLWGGDVVLLVLQFFVVGVVAFYF